jgi:RHS repeat-associated protein
MRGTSRCSPRRRPRTAAGQYNDPLSGSYHLRARDYAANSGRFNSVDPLARSTGDPAQSSYAFGDNNPLSNSDPSGMGCGIFSFARNAASSAYHEVKQAVTTTDNTVVQVTTDVVNKGVELVKDTVSDIKKHLQTRSRKTLWVRPRRSYTMSPTPPTKWAIGSTSIRLRSPVSPPAS